MLLNELWNPEQALPIKWSGAFAPEEVYATATDSRGRNIDIVFSQVLSAGGAVVEIEFVVNGAHEITGQGNQFQVFNTVINAITEYLTKYGRPRYIMFSSKGASRTRLYTRLVKQVARTQGYLPSTVDALPQETQEILQDIPGSSGDVFVLRDIRPRKSAESELDEGWREKAAAAMTAATLGYGAMHNMMPQQEPQPVQQQQTQRDPVFQGHNALRDSLVDYAKRAGIRGTELAHFVAQMAHETANWRHMEEQPPQGARNPQRYFARKYEGKKILGNVKPGDGYRYRGRGFVQLTGRDNYTRAGRALGVDLVNDPDLASRPDVAAKIAVWFWKNRVAPRVGDFERADVRDVTQGINPGQRGAEQRAAHFQRIANK